MTYLVAADLNAIPAGERFRALVDAPQILQLPGTHNGLAALQAKRAAFPASPCFIVQPSSSPACISSHTAAFP